MTGEPMTEEQTIERCRELGDQMQAHHEAIKQLSTERRKHITALSLRFGLTYRAIGPLLGMSNERVSQIINGNWRPR